MVFYNKPKKKRKHKGAMQMINEEICKLRKKLNDSILQGEEYDRIYQISIELDELIAKYYQEKLKKGSCHLQVVN